MSDRRQMKSEVLAVGAPCDSARQISVASAPPDEQGYPVSARGSHSILVCDA
jgi:hypothetical protein